MTGLLGTIVNVILVILGSGVGVFFNKSIPQRLTDTLFKAMGLVVVFIGVTGCMNGGNTLIVVVSMILGTLLGELADLDKQINKVGKLLEKKFDKNNPNSTMAEGFVSASMLFCIGSMAIVGCLQAGLNGDCSILYTKSAIDLCSAMIFASTMGIGVAFSAVSVFLYQGLLTVLAVWVSPFLSEVVITNMSCVGYVVIIGLALTMLGATKLKVTNLVPAMFLPILLCPLGDWLVSVMPFLAG